MARLVFMLGQPPNVWLVLKLRGIYLDRELHIQKGFESHLSLPNMMFLPLGFSMVRFWSRPKVNLCF